MQETLKNILEIFHRAPRLDSQRSFPGMVLAIQRLHDEAGGGTKQPRAIERVRGTLLAIRKSKLKATATES